MTTEEMVNALKICAKMSEQCKGCPMMQNIPNCYSALKLMVAKELEYLRTENQYLRAMKGGKKCK